MKTIEKEEQQELICKLYGMSFMLKIYCDNLNLDALNKSSLKDFSNVIYATCNELYDLFYK